MTEHWSIQYIGEPFTPERNCFWWFREITRRQFGRDVPQLLLDISRFMRSAIRAMQADIEAMYSYRPTDAPREGDAVFLGRGDQPHHLGMIVEPGNPGELWVLHALEGSGVICQQLATLSAEGWRIGGYWTYAG